MSVYRAMMDRPGGVMLGGDSAGGGLVLALLSEICRLDLRRPLGVFALSLLTDMTYSGDSVIRQAEADVILPAHRTSDMTGFYLGDGDPLDPRASPLFATFKDAPPVWICAGDTEILLDDTRRMAEHLRGSDVAVTEVIARDLPHVWPMFHNILPEARSTLREIAAWVNSLAPLPTDN